MWESFCSKLRPQGAGRVPGGSAGSWRGSECSHMAQVGSSHSLAGRIMSDVSSCRGSDGEAGVATAICSEEPSIGGAAEE